MIISKFTFIYIEIKQIYYDNYKLDDLCNNDPSIFRNKKKMKVFQSYINVFINLIQLFLQHGADFCMKFADVDDDCITPFNKICPKDLHDAATATP